MKAWPGREALLHLRAQRLDLDRLDEALDHRQGHVRFQQCHARLAQRLGDVLLGDAAAAAQASRVRDRRSVSLVEHDGAMGAGDGL